MKKSEALNILGLTDGATDDAVKQAHRKLVIAHHPDKFALNSPERAQAEELTKRINEARDVLLNRSWTPEFDPRRDPRPYAGNPYAHPSGYTGGTPGGRSASGGAGSQDPFANWPFGQSGAQGPGQGAGRTTYVWTSWDDARSTTGQGSPFDTFDPFDPFAPFRSNAPQQTPQEAQAEAARNLKSEALVIACKVAVLVITAFLGAVATGLFFYTIVSVAYGLWKRLGSCLIGLIVPIVLVGVPFILIIAPRQGAVTVTLGLAFLVAAFFDIKNMRNRIRLWRAAKRASA